MPGRRAWFYPLRLNARQSENFVEFLRNALSQLLNLLKVFYLRLELPSD